MALGALVALPRLAIAQVAVDLELILAVDASDSVSAAEFDLQVQGLAGAFRDTEVIAAIRDTGPTGIAVALVQWAGPGQQIVAVDWSRVSDADSAAALARQIVAAGRLIMGETAIDGGLAFAMGLLTTNDLVARRRIIDVSGDGETNWGAPPDRMRDRAVAAGITVNGLAIVNKEPGLAEYYRVHVIGGAGAFVVTATNYVDFARAIRIKLIREIGEGPLSYRPSSPYRPGAGQHRRNG